MTLFCVFCNVHYLSHRKNEHDFGVENICRKILIFIKLISIISLIQKERDPSKVLIYFKKFEK
jgi:hypothetical protein